jgi:hypothetical protein
MMDFPASPVWLLEGQLIFPELGDSWLMGRASNVHWMTRLRWFFWKPSFQVMPPKKRFFQSRWPWKDHEMWVFSENDMSLTLW